RRARVTACERGTYAGMRHSGSLAAARLPDPIPTRFLGRRFRMKLTSESFADGQPIPAEFAFCRIDPKSRVALSSNRNPQLSWSDAPIGTRSFAIVCHDIDVPS